MGQLQKFLEQAELVHHFKRRGVHGVSAKVAQEISVFFHYDSRNTGAREQEREHHARGSSTDDAAGGLGRGHRRSCIKLTRTSGSIGASYACFSGTDTVRPSSSSVTLIWHERRELGRTS